MAKLNGKVKIGLWSVGSLVVLAAFGALALFTLANRAVNDFRADASDQLNTAVSGKTTGVPTALKTVWLGDWLNISYKKVDGLQANYRALLGDVKNYVAVLNAHDTLVGQYNGGIKGDKPLNGDLLKSVNQYLAVMQNRFPSEKDRIAALNNLSNKITSSTDFDAVSGDIDTILQSNSDWLNSLRDDLNSRITAFQKKIN